MSEPFSYLIIIVLKLHTKEHVIFLVLLRTFLASKIL
ncbi:hypothetical protein CLOLEP_00947 [[Clostridium] leptum DSM 753]|uniref:Uncharacterized protein n=1 Tax=[Clostridium] leptum DSM 753 TaxID=428125 RepID=A7VQW6_9FIRM|nr:hypothetical protein CLOLEP_00947 [[Clostridium] leptum DSM 753]